MLSMFSRGSASKDSVDIQSQKSPSTSSNVPSNFTGPARPIRLVYCDDKGKFRMDPEAVAALQLLKEPVGVVAVCGRARQGKSFILNQLLGKSSGFKVASTHRPCTKGLWLWSAPIGRTALDGTKYNLLLLDSEGIDAYDQTGTYSTQIFSLAVLLSSMFIYNQMGGIDEAALDRLSLVTQVTKHIRVRASGGRGSTSELGQFSPVFIWLLRDFYLDLVEDNRQITPRDYLELALRAVQGGGKDISAKNEIRESIRALFPDRECFTLVRPLNNENDLQRLDQISLDKMRPEFKSGLNSMIKFVFERTRPKQVGATVMTGPILVRITETYLDALNNGAVPTIFSSWQSVEEAECRSAYDTATEVYMQTFDRSKPPEEALLREAHDEAAQKAVTLFNTSAVGAGTTRQKYDSLLQKFMKKGFEDYKKNAFMAADIFCSNQVKNMESMLRTTCLKYDAKLDEVLKVLDNLLSDYESKCHGPRKWQKLAKFLRQSLEGPIHDFIKNQVQKTASEMSSLQLKCRSMVQQTDLLNKQLESSEKQKSEYLKRYEDAINDKNKIADDYMSRIANFQSNCSSLNEKCTRISRNLENAKQESEEWKRKYDHILATKKSQDDQNNAEHTIMKSKISAAEARLAAIKEKAESSHEEAEEWREKYEISVREAKYALEKTAAIQDRTSKHAQQREDVLRSEFADILADKETEIKEKSSRIEEAEQHLTTLSLELKASVSKVASYEAEVSSLSFKLEEVCEKLEMMKTKAQSFEKQAEMLEQEKAHLEQAYGSGAERVHELQGRCREAEKDGKRATEAAERALAEAAEAQKEKAESQRVAMESMAAIEKTERRIERAERQMADLEEELKRVRLEEAAAVGRAAELERAVEEREKKIQLHLRSNNEQRADTIHVLEKLLESERVSRAEANTRAEDLSLQLQTTQAKLDALQQELTAVRLTERTPGGKRTRATDSMAEDGAWRWSKRMRGEDEEEEEVVEGEEDYRNFTVQKLKQELTKHNHGDELLRLRNPNKKEILSLYHRLVLHKS